MASSFHQKKIVLKSRRQVTSLEARTKVHTGRIMRAPPGEARRSIGGGGQPSGLSTTPSSSAREEEEEELSLQSLEGELLGMGGGHRSEEGLGGMLVFTWGRGEDGQLGHDDQKDQLRPQLVEVLRGKGVADIACGSGHTVVRTLAGEVYTWGRGDDGRLGHGDTGWKWAPMRVEALAMHSVAQVTCGSYHTAAVTSDGLLFTWGGGMYGKLGQGDEKGHPTPQCVKALREVGRVKQVACGSRHTVALLENHTVYCWGAKEDGVSGHDDDDGAAASSGGGSGGVHHYAPQLVETLVGVSVCQVSACGFHTCVVSMKGKVYSWGQGKFGRLGHGNDVKQSRPTQIDKLNAWCIRQVSAGGFHTAAVAESGELFTWGGGEHGQLGHGTKMNQLRPELVESLRAKGHFVLQVTCGWSHTVALTQSGEVFTWGNGDHGKLGHGNTDKICEPKAVAWSESIQGLVRAGCHVVRVSSYNEHTGSFLEWESYYFDAIVTESLTIFYSNVLL